MAKIIKYIVLWNLFPCSDWITEPLKYQLNAIKIKQEIGISVLSYIG